MGFDPGLASCGYGVVQAQGSRVRHLSHGVILTPSGQSDAQRLLIIHRRIVELIQEFRPRAAGIESLFFAKNVSSAIPVAQARGAIVLSCGLSSVPTKDFSPVEIKQRVTGVGRAAKSQVQLMIEMLLGIPATTIDSDHAADALAAAFCMSQDFQERIS